MRNNFTCLLSVPYVHNWLLRWLSGLKKKKFLPAIQEMQFQSLHQEDPLEKEMATHSSSLALRILWILEPGGLQSMGSPNS